MKRRSFFVGTTAAIAGGSAFWGLNEWQDLGHPLANSAAARRIGERFAKDYPEDPAALWKGPIPRTAVEWGPRLGQLRQEDFDSDRLVEVDGWWLAETEIRFCVFLYANT